MRGKEKFANTPDHCFRITPAYAGKSFPWSRKCCPVTDHPRLCGEKPASSSLVMFQPGSPPPMRGKEKARTRSTPRRRITPAYAGKSFERLGKKLCRVGSPPPMRGKVFPVPPQVLERRITPAYAGKSQQNTSTTLC